MDEDSPLIFHVGWAEKAGWKMMATDDYKRRAKAIADALIAVRFIVILKSSRISVLKR